MASSKTTVNKRNLIPYAIVFGLGIIIGLIVQDIPHIQLKREADLGAIIAVIGLIATAFYLPNVVERKFKKTDSINEIIRADLELILNDVEKLKSIYRTLNPSAKIKLGTYTEILGLFKSISADIIALNTQLGIRSRLPNFKNDVYVDKYIPAKEACTNELIQNQLLSVAITSNAISELDKLCAELRKFRYETFSEK